MVAEFDFASFCCVINIFCYYYREKESFSRLSQVVEEEKSDT